MKHIILLSVLTIYVLTQVNAQENYMDSLIQSKNTKLFEGEIPVYFVPDYQEKAIRWQSNIIEAKHYYEKKYKGVNLKIKLAVLDSVNWTTEIFSYGYVYVKKDWVVLVGDINFDDFMRIYGAHQFENEILKKFTLNNIKPEELPAAFFQFAAIHELGHLLMNQMIGKPGLGNFYKEIAANTIAFEFLKTNNPQLSKVNEIFFDTCAEEYDPKYSSLDAYFQNYGKMSVANYVWYHSKFMKLVEDIYHTKNSDFLLTIKNLCQNNEIDEMGLHDLAMYFDRHYENIFSEWLKNNNN